MFEGGENSYLGIDIGTSSIKVAELSIVNNKPFLSNYAWMKLEDSVGSVNVSLSEGILFEYLKHVVRESQFRGSIVSPPNVYMSLPSFGGLMTLVEFPVVKKDDLEQAIKAEAHKYIPTSLNEVVLSWDILTKFDENQEEIDDPSKKIQVLLVAAPKNRVDMYKKLIESLGLNLSSIEIESFSLARALVGNDPGNFVVVDIGSRVCNIILVEGGNVKVSRNIDAGGKNITREISKGMSIDESRAENIKTSGKNFFDNQSNIFFPVLEMVSGEIKRVLSNYYKNSSYKIDAIILSGGTSNLKNIDQYFFNALNIRTVIGNPLGRVEYDKRLEPKIKDVKSQFAVCIGLALRGVENYFLSKNK